jgi:hypothetical protein
MYFFILFLHKLWGLTQICFTVIAFFLIVVPKLFFTDMLPLHGICLVKGASGTAELLQERFVAGPRANWGATGADIELLNEAQDFGGHF